MAEPFGHLVVWREREREREPAEVAAGFQLTEEQGGGGGWIAQPT